VTQPRRSERTAELFRAYQSTGERRFRNEIVELHRDVAEYYIKRYSRRGVPADDLRQVALLTVVRAVDRFDLAQGVEFSTFASRTIEGELKRYFRDKTWTVRPPRRAQELHLALRRAEEEMAQRMGRSPTVEELAVELDETVDHVLEAMEAGVAHQGASLDQPAGGNNDADGAVLAERVLAHHDVGFAHVDRQLVVREVLDTLDERDRRIIELRFFENRTQEEIADVIGVSQSYLSRILRRVLLDLRKKLDAESEIDDIAAV
jgi:RNA polymerase sigma-B factor